LNRQENVCNEYNTFEAGLIVALRKPSNLRAVGTGSVHDCGFCSVNVLLNLTQLTYITIYVTE